ncbi:MAG: gamma carbonic anhydrase family protein [Pseudomonadales bacterium]|nr:gamma carbonic anhydrase family protein [Pseudomonadales bacterium]MDP6471650.1 gamma carbonic anhydrase family protein [Pseudomonadales bacterium]MDP6973064.1 gamma carbonic anhydrase family protein [Pseudomonadales bacterium]
MIYQLEDRRVVAQGDYFIADSASVIGSVTLKHNASVWCNAVIRGDKEPIVVGEGSNVQDCAILHTDPGFALVVGDNVTVGHQVVLHGCTVGEGSLIGMGAIVLNGARIGRNCVIGANALVTEGKEIPDNSMVLGSPGKVVKTLTDEEMQVFHDNSANYVANGRWFREKLIPQDEVDRP